MLFLWHESTLVLYIYGMYKRTVQFVLIFFLYNSSAFADSPLTSTEIYKAYADHPMVQRALGNKGVLDKKQMSFLRKESNPVEEKIAVINALGWDFNGKFNALEFKRYLHKKRKLNTDEKLEKNGSAAMLICLAYLQAMDNYHQVRPAFHLANMAKSKSPNSLTVNLIRGLIHAQYDMDQDWCMVYTKMQKVKEDGSLNQDMKEAAVEAIFSYIGLYKEYCR